MTTGMRLASENEYKILKLMWETKEPMSRSDILKGTEGRNWNPASIHLILNSMISKGIIKITDESKNYGRTYEPTLDYEEYVISAIGSIFPGEDTMEVLHDCAKIYNKMKKESK